MPFTKVTDPVNNVSNLANQPVESPTNLKAVFDEIGKDLKTYLNNTLTTELESTTDGGSGLDNIGMTPIVGLTALTPQAALEEITARTPINVADNSLTELKMANEMKKDITGGVSSFSTVQLNQFNRQAIIDGGFQISQNKPIVGTLVTNPLNNTYPVFDMWKVEYTTGGAIFPNITHTQQNNYDVVPNVNKMCRITTDGAGSGFSSSSVYVIDQFIENGVNQLCGTNKKISVSFYARSTIANKRLGVFAYQNYGTGGSPTPNETLVGKAFDLTTDFQKFTYTFNTTTLSGKTFGTNNDDAIVLLFAIMWGSGYNTSFINVSTPETFVGAGDIEITGVQLNTGNVPMDFATESFVETLNKCQRYYEKSYNKDIAPGAVSTNGSIWDLPPRNTANFSKGIEFKVSKRINPVVKIYSPLTGAINSVSNNGDKSVPFIGNIGTEGFSFIQVTGGDAAQDLYYHYTSDSRY